MSSRYPPPSGFNSRDRSPPPRFDRRPPHGRGYDDGLPASLAREPPRGPKALVDHPRGGPFGGRGRGHPGRGDFRDRDRDFRDRDRDRDRDFRDFRDGPPPFRRDNDREWGRRDRDFDTRDARGGFGRGRSRTPPPLRDFRDARDPPGRDLDVVRMRRNSRDSINSTSSVQDGPLPPVGRHPRGGFRGRGRGRGSYLDDRDSFRRRSRSRDAWRERGRDRDRTIDRDRDLFRDRERDFDRRDSDRPERFERRPDFDRRPDRDERDRPGAPWKTERSSIGAGPRTASPANQQGPFAPPVPGTGNRPLERFPPALTRKVSGPEGRYEPDRAGPTTSRPATPNYVPPSVQRSTPPPAPQVPAFGSIMTSEPSDRRFSEIPPPGPPQTMVPKRAEQPARGPAQAPTAPKADRGSPQLPFETRFRHDEGPEPLHNQDLMSRISRPPPDSTTATAPPTAISTPAAPMSMTRDASATRAEMFQPRGTGPGPTSPEFGRTPPPVRSAYTSPQTSPHMQTSGIPTGPRAYQQRPPPPRGPKPNKPWARSAYNRAPSLPNAFSMRRESLEEKERRFSASDESRRESHFPRHEMPQQAFPPFLHKPDESAPTSGPLKDSRDASPDRMSVEGDLPDEGEIRSGDVADSAMVPDFSRSSDEEEEEEGIVFTQDYLEERKRIFERDMAMLRANMPAPPLEDPNIVALLLRIQLLGQVANDVVPDTTPKPEMEEEPEPPNVDPPSSMDYKLHREADESVPSKDVLESLPVANELTIEDLPFLQTGPPTPISDLEVYQENKANHEKMKEIYREEMMSRRKDIARKNAALRDDYMSYYRPWRMDVWEQDRVKGKQPVSPAPTTPPAPPIIPPMATSMIEGRRRKGNSELDFQNALRASEISAREELERRKENKATAQPDLNREAVIPEMLEPEEVKDYLYKDSNNKIDSANAKQVFGFFPPANDFTSEEHEKFTNAFMAHPKRWGKIAESLPGRNFQQCIVHYYLTKEEIKYKAKLNKRWSRRGRAKRSIRPKSNALMADLGVVKPDYEGDEEAAAPVTDTGRPRRAAAPTFGDSSADTDNVPTGRRVPSGREGEQIEKPVSRRGRGGGPGSRGGRRGRAQQHLVADQMSLGFAEPSMDGTTETAVFRAREQTDREPGDAPPRARVGRGRAREGMYVFESMDPDAAPARQQEMGYGSLQPTSYWSVPEQRDFPMLLAHFGRDFEGISNFMKTKTTVMAKNYYQRRIDSGQKDFEDIVLIAEGKKARGEPTGPLPVPSVAPKRRYEATPSAVVPRPLAPHTEPGPEGEDSRYGPRPQPAALSPQGAPLHARPLPEMERNVGRYPPLAQAGGAPMPAPSVLNEDPSRSLLPPGSMQQRMQGPRMGYFTEDKRDSTGAYSANRLQDPHAPADAMRIENFRQPTDIHGSPLASAQNTAQGYIPSQAPPSLIPRHSRQSSITQPPGSPPQPLHRPEADTPHLRRESIGQRTLCALPGQPAGLSHRSPAFSPTKEAVRPGLTAEVAEQPRQVPAKRSNIMNILNDEPEEPQPRKRHTGDQPSSRPGTTLASPSRPVYAGMPSLTQQAPPLRGSEPHFSATQQRSYGQQGHYLPPPPPGYSDYQGYGSGPGNTGAPATNDWMARFDPRGQQPPQLGHRSSQPFSPYTANPPHSGPALSNLTAPSPAPTPSPAPGPRHGYTTSLFAQPGATRQEAPPSQVYRQPSPPPRTSSVAYNSRQGPPTPIESPANLLNISRHPSVQPGYGSAQPSGQETYQQHVQTLVNGAHQPQTHRPSLSFGDGQFGHRTPPPPLHTSRGLPGPSSLASGRSYTPPAALQPTPSGGLAYPGPSTPGSMSQLHSRQPGEAAPGSSDHHRVYSQGSTRPPPPSNPHYPPR